VHYLELDTKPRRESFFPVSVSPCVSTQRFFALQKVQRGNGGYRPAAARCTYERGRCIDGESAAVDRRRPRYNVFAGTSRIAAIGLPPVRQLAPLQPICPASRGSPQVSHATRIDIVIAFIARSVPCPPLTRPGTALDQPASSCVPLST